MSPLAVPCRLLPSTLFLLTIKIDHIETDIASSQTLPCLAFGPRQGLTHTLLCDIEIDPSSSS